MQLIWSVLFLCLFSIGNHAPPTQERQMTLNLKWNKAYPDDSIDNAMIGLEWAFSYCGALLPNAPYAFDTKQNVITIDVTSLGFDAAACEQLTKLHHKIKASEEYQTQNAIDLGRYVTLLLGASEHYYAITGLPKRLDSLLSQYELSEKKGYVNHSGVSLEHRIIRFSEQQHLKQLFIASEIDSVSGKIYEFETVDIMPNGQLRYGVFDADGNRINAADATHSSAGKPAKCIWCHESIIQPLFNPQKDFPNFLAYAELKQKLAEDNQAFHNQKVALQTGVDFLKNTQNTQTELLYIAFMEPSAERLSLEWALPMAQVQNLLIGLPTHTHKEFPFLGVLYDRNQVEHLAPKKGLPVSSAVREHSPNEVNHLN